MRLRFYQLITRTNLELPPLRTTRLHKRSLCCLPIISIYRWLALLAARSCFGHSLPLPMLFARFTFRFMFEIPLGFVRFLRVLSFFHHSSRFISHIFCVRLSTVFVLYKQGSLLQTPEGSSAGSPRALLCHCSPGLTSPGPPLACQA